MKSRNIIIVIFFLLISSMVLGQKDLNRYLETAAENNPELQAKFNEYMAALEVVPQAKALPDPQIAFAYFVSPVETRMGPQEFKISASQFFHGLVPWQQKKMLQLNWLNRNTRFLKKPNQSF